MDETTIQLWQELKSLYERSRSPVPTVIIADFAGYSERHARRKLSALRDTQAVRKHGRRGGWVPVQEPRPQYEQLMLPLFAA